MVFFCRKQLEDLLSPLGYPFRWDNHETENKFLQPKGWLDEIQFFTDEIGQKVVKVPTDCHHDKEHGVFMKKREWHLFPEEIVVHLVKQPFAFAPVVVEFNNFEVGHLTVICHYCPVGEIVTEEQVALFIRLLFPGYHVAVGFVPAKWAIFNGCHLIFFEPDCFCFPISYILRWG